ncbi:MAG: hypothetical protein R2761_10920 [Acidimicrobiales bacterium]
MNPSASNPDPDPADNTVGPGLGDQPGPGAGWHLSAGRALAVVLLPTLVLLAVGPLPLLVWSDRLPDRLASHWSGSGGPDGSMGPGGLLLMTVAAIVVAVAGLGWAALSRRRRDPFVYPFVVFLVLVVAGMICAAAASIVAVNLDEADWRDVGPLPWWHLVLVISGPLALAAAGARALPPMPVGPAPTGTTAATPLGTGERAVWVGTLTNRWLHVPPVVLCVAGQAWLVVGPGRWIGLTFVPLGLATSVLATVRVTVDRRGLQVAYGPLHWPRTRFPVERIESADVIEVHPTQWGGWGYRGSVRLMKRAAVVLRRGPGLHLRLRDGSEFAVTVDHPEPGAELLNRILVAAGPAPG